MDGVSITLVFGPMTTVVYEMVNGVADVVEFEISASKRLRSVATEPVEIEEGRPEVVMGIYSNSLVEVDSADEEPSVELSFQENAEEVENTSLDVYSG